jgi:signal transduction histidine kinase
MKSRPVSDDMLAHAFRRFERAATSLVDGHAALQTEVERLDRQLLDAHRRLETVLDAVDSGVAVVSADGIVIRSNRTFQLMELGSPGERLRDDVLRDLADEDPERGGTIRLAREDRRGTRDLAVTVVPVGDEERSRVFTVQDVTEIRRQEEEGGRRRRLESLGRMAAEIAHEVRNPLGSIRLFAGMLQHDLEDQPEHQETVEQILAAVSGLESAVLNLLAFASPARGASRSLDLSALAGDTCALLAPGCALRGVDLEGPNEDRECPAVADPEGMRQVLLNLLSNALAATQQGDTIRVTARRENDHAVLEVEDTGRGIESADMPRVFDPFFSRSDNGTGLGLSIVHGIIERHGGRIALDSAPGKGTRVRVELPAGTPGEKQNA